MEREQRECNLKLEVIYHESNKLADDFFLIVIQEDGQLDGVVISFIDIDELKTIQQQIHLVNEELKASQSELRQFNQDLEERVEERTQALQKSEARLRAILETTSSIIYSTTQKR